MRRVLLGVLGILVLGFLYFVLTVPNVAKWKRTNPISTAFMERYPGLPLQIWVNYQQISPHLKQAVVLAEDARFFEHWGIDRQAIKDAAQRNWREGRFKWGASTITQQLAKNLYLNPSKNPLRKIREILIALALEYHLSKQRILEIYLNVVEWGDGIYGIEAAARYYFKVPAIQLSPAQSARLASMLPSPRYYQHHFQSPDLDQKAAVLLRRMGY